MKNQQKNYNELTSINLILQVKIHDGIGQGLSVVAETLDAFKKRRLGLAGVHDLR